ncbi:unnamed protein product [Rotaria sp. Silwood2]|nr:unnamed protein product [Rotaria sp. Silwood2]CAF3111016.1 unnamed protein product [Rotaria sp. Silwood2]CAF4014904.1 unnamed protein product [Rotaria sp. Silwood2]CAF4411513.1 unnamed protein product [Rotaria sp. Silwood2]
MRVFRKKKRYYNHPDGEPLPDIVYQMGAEAAARYVALASREQQAYAAINPYEQAAMYNQHHVPMVVGQNYIDEAAEYQIGGNPRRSSPLNFIASPFGLGRSGSREHFSRAGSPAHFHQYQPGSPAHYHQRSHSPELIRSRPSSPVPFIPPVRSTPADVARRLQRAQLSQDLQRMERYERRQEEMMLANGAQFVPQYQQVQMPYYSMNPMLQQPQMYPYYY